MDSVTMNGEICQPLYDDVAAAGIEKNEILLAHGGDEQAYSV